ncbi:RNA-guided endonuclease InsQ/TnpB family protein [Cyanobacterium aponinum]|uniref:IS200/IS605 family element transposase accessory protein TnpB n=1 Tax=Cyanobacterium aponinum 0216 TaxID=2676140 RepID=A0A844GWD9_9CHRO|nr:RNA-guided endonuclease TnpB family protein [Cyanobacterium aponinum]MTF38326.1 IS200/IS605 family element transposase accessory protein TnpB [Cyanobacterium aponinum 0216]
MIVTHKYKLNPSESQEQKMRDWISMLSSHYNYCLRDRIEAYEEVKAPRLGEYCDLRTRDSRTPLTCSISKNSNLGEPFKNNGKKRNAYEQQSSELPSLKKSHPWYKTIHSTVLQQNLRRLDKAFQNFFDGRGYPKFKKRHQFKSFTYPPNQVKVEGNKIYLPSIGWMRMHLSRPLRERFEMRSVTIRQKADGFYVAIQLEDKTIPQTLPIDLAQVKTVLGVDCGARPHKLLALSNGENIANPQYEKKLAKRKTLRQRRCSRKKRGSNNQRQAFKELARLDQKIVNQREDYQWKVAHKLNRIADVIVMEDLNIQGMIRKCKPKQDEKGHYLKNGQSAKKALNRLIRDCSWGELKDKIRYCAEKFGRIFLEVNPKYSSQTCSHCGFKDKKNRHKESFLCLNCGTPADADTNASITLAKRGVEKLGISLDTLLGVTQEVTGTSESTDASNRDISETLVSEPTNPLQLSLFEWMNGRVIGC